MFGIWSKTKSRHAGESVAAFAVAASLCRGAF